MPVAMAQRGLALSKGRPFFMGSVCCLRQVLLRFQGSLREAQMCGSDVSFCAYAHSNRPQQFSDEASAFPRKRRNKRRHLVPTPKRRLPAIASLAQTQPCWQYRVFHSVKCSQVRPPPPPHLPRALLTMSLYLVATPWPPVFTMPTPLLLP